MSRAVQLRRGTTAQTATFTGLLAELTVDTDQNILILHDGVTAGGHKVATQAYVAANAGIGPKGDKGDKGDPGTNGTNGVDGASAYQVAVAAGFVGDTTAWLASLKGAQGDQGLKGDKGDSATGNITFTGTNSNVIGSTIGELSLTGSVGINNPNPSGNFTLEIGNLADLNDGDLGLNFSDGTGNFSGVANLGWAWNNGGGLSNSMVSHGTPPYAFFGIFKGDTKENPWITFDRDTPDNVLTFAPDGAAIFIGPVVSHHGAKFTNAPTSAIGSTGDSAGTTIIADGYIFYCTANYDGSTNIWTRTPLNGTW